MSLLKYFPVTMVDTLVTVLARGVQSENRFSFGSVFFGFSVSRLVKYNYHSKSIFTSVWFGLYTAGFGLFGFIPKHNYLV